MKVAWQSLEMICRRRVALCLLLLLTLESTFADDYPSIYIPIGVGKAQDFKALQQFGKFKDPFLTCGKKTSADGQLNPSITGHTMELEVICEPSPDRIIVAAGDTNYGQHQRSLKKECELLTCSKEAYKAVGSDMGTIQNGANPGVDIAKAPNPEKPETNVCGGNKAAYSNGDTGTMLFANEAKCFETYPKLEQDLYDQKFKQVPRWLEAPKQQHFLMRPFYFTGAQKRSTWQSRVNYQFTQVTDMAGLTYKDCVTACDSGKVVKITLHEAVYEMMIYVQPKCKAFRICLETEGFDDDQKVPVCQDKKMINVLVENGVVLWPNDHRASLIELKSQKHQANHPVAIEFGWNKNFYIMNDHRERVETDVLTASGEGGYNNRLAHRLAFFFPEEDCLKEKAGIFSDSITVGKALTSKTVIKGDTYDVTTKQKVVITAPTVIKEEEAPEQIFNIALTTTVAPLVVAPGAVSLDDQLETNIGSAAAYVSGKWWTWGIYIGFVIGTLLTLGIGAGIFYLLRRTVFGVWYRGMYKRYGCDVSGTTGGITGVGFGNTVTGDVTVKGTTGGTTGGTTRGTTGTTGTSSTMDTKTGTSTLGL